MLLFDINFERIRTLRAAHRVISLLARQADDRLAVGAFAVYVGLAFTEAVILQSEPVFDRSPYLHKTLVFPHAGIDIARKRPYDDHGEYRKHYKRKHKLLRKHIDDGYQPV